MKSSAKNISLNSYDDIFSTEETREDAKREKVTGMPLSELHPFPDHPFQVRDDDSMKETVESIKEYGVLVPAIVHPRADGGYELISGNRRKHACELAGLPTMPVIVRDLDDDAATIIMVDSNIQRENILPSERAKAYKMKLDAMKRQAGRPSLENGGQVGHDLRGIKTRDLIAENSEDSARTIQRYIRLNELTPQLQQMVDDKKIAMTPAVELSYLKPEEQTLLLDTIESEQATPSLSQAQRLKNFSQEGHLNEDSILAIMSEEKKPEKNDLTIKADKLQKYFPKSYTPQQMEQVIIRLLDGWQKKRQRDQER
ncbi:ParB/RepB/Spo0J family partition protein [Caproiciproducens sp. NJN-50]|uniref:ParB/RepB/Spo0J family partition protein n=1 Tax=Acutalibacteraceae TaxID=3082771 RepID=UPI000FFE0EDD|nr:MULTISPECIES: ParB/RepB/Spo0J family partition protein [Acutalibacteraceae]QAT50258.1 ParB/RepB/Spo0J family partition protein [Caproiciproducens sp. NJN-50]